MSATPATTTQWADGIDPAVRWSIDQGRGEIPKEKNMWFSVKDSDRETESVLSFGDLVAMGQFTGNIDFEPMKQNFRKNITAVEYAKGTSIQYRLVKTQQLNIVDAIGKALGRAELLRYLIACYDWINNGFGSYTVGDTLSLFNTAHTSNVGGGNQSNSGTLELSYANVDATVVAMGKFLTPSDQMAFDTKPDTLVVPLDLEAYANEIAGSKGKPDAITNNINYYYGRFDVIAARPISDTNNWAMVNKKRMKENQFWFDVVPRETERDREISSKVARWTVYAFFGYGSAGWDWCYGQNVA